jgi:hypothetical protein
VKFIEASWVANPAFRGAVLRNILSAEDVSSIEKKMHMAFTLPTPVIQSDAMSKAARRLSAQGEQEQAPAEDPLTAPAPDDSNNPSANPVDAQQSETDDADPIAKAVKELSTALREQAIEHVRNEISKGEAQAVRDVVEPAKGSDTIVKSAMRIPAWRRVAKTVISFVGKTHAKRVLHGLLLHKQGGWSRVREAGFSGREVLALSRVLDRMTKKSSMAGEARLYRAVLSVGGTGPYEDEETYLAACRQVLGRGVTGSEASRLLQKGRLYSGRSR